MGKKSAEAHDFGPGSETSKGKGHPIMFGDPKQTSHFRGFEEGGGYPKRFVEWALQEMGCKDEREVLHLCSGSMISGVTVDIRPETSPTIVADCRELPFPDEFFRFIMADPPYTKEYARNLYGTEDVFPKPFQILKEACRVCQVEGKIGLLHFQVPMFRKPLKLLGTYGITTGLGYNIRCWSLFEKSTHRG